MPSDDNSKQKLRHSMFVPLCKFKIFCTETWAKHSYDLFCQWSYADQQSPAKRQQQFNAPDSHYWNDHRLRTGVTNATSISVPPWGTKILHNACSECNYAKGLATDKSCLSREGMLLDKGKGGTGKSATRIPTFACYRVRTLSSWQDRNVFFMCFPPTKGIQFVWWNIMCIPTSLPVYYYSKAISAGKYMVIRKCNLYFKK